MKKTKISVVVNTLNAQKYLKTCLDSVKGWADEIVVVDMHSIDNTLKIAKKYQAKTYLHPRLEYVEPARNFAISKAKNQWVLVLDADEAVSQQLKNRLSQVVNNDQADWVKIPRKNIIFKKWLKHTRWWPDYQVRFFKKGRVNWQEKIHIQPKTSGKGLTLESSPDLAITHHHYQTVSQYLGRLDRYTTIQAQEKSTPFKPEALVSQPLNEFLGRYYHDQGFKDGVHGLALSLLQAFSHLVVEVKFWQESGFKNKINQRKLQKLIQNSGKSLVWWSLDWQINHTKNPVKKIWLKIKRKIIC